MNAYARTFDPHSNYFSARNSEEYRIQMSLSYEGIGATLQTDDDYASIVNLLPGGPAAIGRHAGHQGPHHGHRAGQGRRIRGCHRLAPG